MKKGKYAKQTKNVNVWPVLIVVLVVVIVAVILAIWQPWQLRQSEPNVTVSEDFYQENNETDTTDQADVTEEMDANLENNTFFVDLSCSGIITDVNGEICFVADQMYHVEIDDVVYENINIFHLNDPNYQNWAEQTVTVRAAAISKSDEKFMLDLQYIVSDDVCVSTPFSEYHFPAEWADRLLVKHSYSDSDYTVAFYADMDGVQEYLFSIVMGENDGTPIGKLTDDMDAVTMVYLLNREDNFEGYSQTEQDYLYSMMEGINYLFDELAENPQFSDEF